MQVPRGFRALLRLYPGEFRDEYGREVALVFADRYRDAATRGERLRVWLEALAGVLREAPKEHGQVLLQDARFAARMLWRAPVFALTVIGTLALGIGANTAIFRLINAVQLRSLPIANAHELAEVRITGGNRGFGITPGGYGQLPRPVWEALRGEQEAFSGLFAWSSRSIRAGSGSELTNAQALQVSGEFFSVLGVQPWRGRLLDVADEGPCPASRAVVSHAYWQRALGGRAPGPDLRLSVGGASYEVVGVAPPAFTGLAVGDSFDVAFPFCQPKMLRGDVFDVAVMGRLRPGWDLQRASARLAALSAGIFDATAPAGYSSELLATFRSFTLSARSAASGVSRLRAQYDSPLQLLLAITALVLLIACANLANLMLARAVSRSREVSMRLALGASRIRLVRQFFAESFLLAAIGALAGIAIAQGLSRGLLWALSREGAPAALTLTTDWRVLAFTGAIAVSTCVLFGLLPALRAARTDPAAALKSGGRGSTSDRGRFSLQRLMVVTQIAVSLILLVGALLFVRSFRNLLTFDAGVRQDGIIVSTFDFDAAGVPAERLTEFQRELVEEVRSVPGVVHAAATSNVPLLGSSWTLAVEAGATRGSSKFTWVSPGYFETMGVPILQGRAFGDGDTRTSRPVAVVNGAFVRTLLGGRPPLGQLIRSVTEPGYPATTYEIVGIIPDTRYDSLRGGMPPMAFVPDVQHPSPRPQAAIMIHSGVDTGVAIASVRARIAQSHPRVVMAMDSFQSEIRAGLVRERLLAMLAGFFGILAALLAMVGLYGMISFSLEQRRQEIGIRSALGARRAQLVRMVLREAARLLAVGIVLGGALSLLASRSAASLLFRVEPQDPLVLAAAALLLGGIALVASFIPARRASRVDPLIALRQD